MNHEAGHRKIFGRRRGRRLGSRQLFNFTERALEYQIPGVCQAENPGRSPIGLADCGVRQGDQPVWLEIGFGYGEHLSHLARAYPDVGFIGCEHYVNGVAKLVGELFESGIGNVRVHVGDVRDLLEVLPGESIDRAYLLYPDPWPKRRHFSRRFVTPQYLDLLDRALKSGAELRIATDIGSFVAQALEQMLFRMKYEWPACSPNDWRERWTESMSTRYEQKARREARVPTYLTFVKP